MYAGLSFAVKSRIIPLEAVMMKGDKKFKVSNHWLLTSPHRFLTVKELASIEALKQLCYDWCFASEGEEADCTLHFHFAVCFERPYTAHELDGFLPGWNRLEFPNEKWEEVLEYCKKEGSYEHLRERLPQLYSDDFPKWRPWQQAVLDAMKDNVARKVICVVDERGGAGKTYFAMWHAVRHRAAYVPCMKYQDIMRMAFACKGVRMFIFDLPRALTKKQMAHVFASAETLRNGYCYDDRYQWRARYFNPVPVVIYTNQVPDVSQLSADRWIFIYPELYGISGGALHSSQTL